MHGIFNAVTALAFVAAGYAAEFDAAAIKPATLPIAVPGQAGGVQRVGLQMDDAGFLRCSYCSLQAMITWAWDVKPYQVTGPGWITSETYSVEARMPAGTSRENALLMFQELLKSRFRMNMRIEERSFPVYGLAVAGKGPKLTTTDVPANFVSGGSRQIVAPAMSMAGLAARLSARVDRPVIDATGLTGNYAMKLTWDPDSPDGTALDSLFRALREQLGLELKSANANMKVYVIDQAMKTPIEN